MESRIDCGKCANYIHCTLPEKSLIKKCECVSSVKFEWNDALHRYENGDVNIYKFGSFYRVCIKDTIATDFIEEKEFALKLGGIYARNI